MTSVGILKTKENESCIQEVSSLIALLRFCSKHKDIHKGCQLHSDILKKGLLGKDSFVASALISMYAKCGAFTKAMEVLEGLSVRDVVSWSALVAGYTQGGHGKEALSCFEWLQFEGLIPSAVIFICALGACGRIGALDKGRNIHSEIVRLGLLGKNVVLGSALVDMYAKCGALEKAKEALLGLPVTNAVSWNALIAGYVKKGCGKEALSCFNQMYCRGLSPDMVTFICILRACGSMGALDEGKKLHSEIIRKDLLHGNVVLGNALVDMYAKCDALTKAKEVLEGLLVRDVVSWNEIISGYAQGGHGREALNCFEWMQHEGVSPNTVTFVCILRACGSMKALEKGIKVHSEIVRQGLLVGHMVLGGALVDMYIKCSAFLKAKEVLEGLPVRDVISWNALITGYAKGGRAKEALSCFKEMQQEGLFPDLVTSACILTACGSLGALDAGENLHFQMLEQGLLGRNVVLGTALVDMYAKCGALIRAKEVLQGLPVRDVIMWNALISGYAEGEHGKEVLDCFDQLQRDGLIPDEITFACALRACGTIGAHVRGREVHNEIVRRGFLRENVLLGNALVDMYSKCGVFARAKEVLEDLPVRNVVTWSALITGYAQGGHGMEALSCFFQMQSEGLFPDEVTFCCLLAACTYSGLLKEGQKCFVDMSQEYGIIARPEQHTCLVDLFGCAGLFDKAVVVIKKMPSCNFLSVWSALLIACQKWGNVELGRWAFENAILLDVKAVAVYVYMSSIYAAAGMKEEATEIEALRVTLESWRSPICA